MGTLYDKSGKKITWIEAIIQSMKIIGEPSRIEDIYDVMIQKAGIKIPDTAKTPTKTIAEKIYSHSKDSKVGRNAKESLFFKKELGVWGLVEQYFDDPELDIIGCDLDGAEEGNQVLRKHLIRERNSKLVQAAKKNFYNKNGRLYCEVCGFCFEEKYGHIGENFIEAHHLYPVSKMESGDITKVEDFVMVCSNCHRMIHRREPWISDRAQLTDILEYENVELKKCSMC